MDSNSISATIPPSSVEKGECCCTTGPLDMGTYNNSHSGSGHCIAYPTFPSPGLRIDSRIALLQADERKQHPVPSSLHEGDLFFDSLFVSGAKSRRRNPWAAFGSVGLLSLLLLALVVIPLFHTDPLPKRDTLTMLYLPPAAAGSNVNRLPAPPSTFIKTPTKLRIANPVHTTQEVPSPPVEAAGRLVVGGVLGGVAGGIQGGVLSGVLSSTGRAPVLVKTPAPAPKRMRVPAQVAEANLIHDVPPQYPPEAGRARIEGTVVLMAVIGKDGTVQDVRVQSGLSILAQAAIEAVKQWRYRPYLLNGEPVEIDSQITINFNLSRG
jgi:protein TonB